MNMYVYCKKMAQKLSHIFSLVLPFNFVIVTFLTQTSMMIDSINAVSADSNDNYVFNEDGIFRGICIDLWEHIAQDLNFYDYRPKLMAWPDMMESFKNKTANVIVQRVEDGRLSRAGIKEG